MFESENDNLWVRNKINVSCRGGVLLRPIEITFALSGFNGQSRALPLRNNHYTILKSSNIRLYTAAFSSKGLG